MRFSKKELEYLISVSKDNEKMQNRLLIELNRINRNKVPEFYSDNYREISK